MTRVAQIEKTAWWKGSRGEWYVIIQIAFIVLIAVGPRTWNGWPAWPCSWVGSASWPQAG